MSNRLNQEREKKLTPQRIQKAIIELEKRGYRPKSDGVSLSFSHKESKIVYYAYSGWASGKTIKDGRGLKNLLNQLDKG